MQTDIVKYAREVQMLLTYMRLRPKRDVEQYIEAFSDQINKVTEMTDEILNNT